MCVGGGGQEGMGGDWKRDTLLDPLISPLSPHTVLFTMVWGEGGQGRVRALRIMAVARSLFTLQLSSRKIYI